MVHQINFVSVFALGCFLAGVRGDCEAFDENGFCVEPCPDDTELYVADCWNSTMSQPTCSDPESQPIGINCGYKRCDCIEPKVFDKVAKMCVIPEDCADPSDEETSDD